MQIKNISLLSLAAMAVKGATVDKDVNGPMGVEGFDLMAIEWDVQAHPGGENLTLTGTVEEVLKELRTINPNYDQDFGITSLTSTKAIDAAIESAVTQADDTFKDAPVNCAGYDDADRKRLAQGARYLLDVKGKPTRGPGPGSCGRVSCSYNSAIYWCNMDSKAKTLNSFKKISDGAYYVIEKCYRGVGTLVSGRAFHKDNWTVVARWDRC
ncbi:Secreted protein [Colletotrichum scovillei]|uniref:Secreted protein n=1 Tax=Colletotrichum scovillei TaxID=1209932 RepID=A0A9P7UE26_9PEZI|nr:Secreted protein [Colletotrichum scovillei]KAG7071418.1 Secreted protein [Colletotrichum scovillei]KAG7079671.1 Secreted protein [Colletotrichum scovillei]